MKVPDFLGIDIDADIKALAKEWITIQMKINKEKGLGHLAVIEKESNAFIGVGGILPRELNGEKEYEVSYSLKPAYWRKGYGTEIAKRIKEFAFHNIDHHRFISIIEKTNEASANIAKKNGMTILFQTEFRGMKVNVFGVKNFGLEPKKHQVS